MKTKSLKKIAALFVVSFLIYSSTYAANGSGIISINFGSTLEKNNSTCLIENTQVWNNIFKGNSGFLLNNIGEQTSCFLKSNSTGSLPNLFKIPEYPIQEGYSISENEFLSITLKSIPYDNFDVYIYIEDADLSDNKSRIILNGIENNYQIRTTEGNSEYYVFNNLKDGDISFVLDKNVGVEAIQIVENTESSLALENSQNANNKVNLYPTQITDRVTLELNDCNNGTYNVIFYDLSGKIAYEEKVIKELDNQMFYIEPTALTEGFYTVSVEGLDLKFTGNFIVN